MENIWLKAAAMKDKMIATRRDLHKHPESAWIEFRTASIVAERLTKLGYEVLCGADVIDEATMMGVPTTEVLMQAQQRALSEGADPAWVDKMNGGKTGVVGIMHFAKPGKVVALRFDMDSNEVAETTEAEHQPCKEGFRSLHDGLMHACGHDGHVTVGLAVAELIAAHQDEMSGTIKLIFQPGEEGVRGAKAMVATGVVDDVDYFLSGHIGFNANRDGMFACMTGGFLATTKLDAYFTGQSSHAGAAPQEGRNALLAAAAASIALHSISRHGKGASRINVGVLEAGTGRNILPDRAVVKLETRGADTEINEFMMSEAKRMIKATADLYNVEVKMEEVGGAPSCALDEVMGQEIFELVKSSKQFSEVVPQVHLGASEDCSYFMQRVQEKGGQAVYMMYGSALKAGHHNSSFDFNEDCLPKSAAMLTILAKHFGEK
ncbi:MAG TPA: amidohydrolase [Candidatus Avacidaminococcus intestinavium]|uniref:Amidohydrolase n=1 Tax=Candidatus Avacidaminococcus intestinavium TaxID=2840684 RepID=A0A9D1MPY6_9FIRM|nr:amidohydrolase [Candidatus Avacidaminococcus intestinavium]